MICSSRLIMIQLIDLFSAVNYNSVLGHFYELVDDVVTYAIALQRASSYQLNGVAGHLATITSTAENAFLNAIGGTGWISLVENGTSGSFVWSTGPEAGIALSANISWAPGEPNNLTTENCTVLAVNGWNNVMCNTSNQFVVEYECSAGLQFASNGTCIGMFAYRCHIIFLTIRLQM